MVPPTRLNQSPIEDCVKPSMDFGSLKVVVPEAAFVLQSVE